MRSDDVAYGSLRSIDFDLLYYLPDGHKILGDGRGRLFTVERGRLVELDRTRPLRVGAGCTMPGKNAWGAPLVINVTPETLLMLACLYDWTIVDTADFKMAIKPVHDQSAERGG